jgi:hypothetical protein
MFIPYRRHRVAGGWHRVNSMRDRLESGLHPLMSAGGS